MDGFDGGSPDEGFGIFVPSVEELGDGRLKVGDAGEGAASHRFGGEFAEPAFHQVEPAGAGGDEVRDEAGVALEPRLHVGVLVGAVVVHHQVQSDVAGKFRIQAAQEFQKLLVAVPGIALADDFALAGPPGRRTNRWCRCACSRGSSCPGAPSSWAVQAGCGPAPESGSSRPRTAPRPGRADSGTAPPHRSASPETGHRAKA